MVSSFDLSCTKMIARRDQKIVIQGQFLHWRMRLVKKKCSVGGNHLGKSGQSALSSELLRTYKFQPINTTRTGGGYFHLLGF